MRNRPFYHKLYADMIRDKYPDKESLCKKYLQKDQWKALDVIEVNELLFGTIKKKQDVKIDKMHRAYDEQSIQQILIFQINNDLNDSQVANIYGLSRNTIAKWKKQFSKFCELVI